MKDFKKLTVWQKSHQLTLDIDKAINDFPKEELYGLKTRFVDLPLLYLQILQRDAEGTAFPVSSKWPWGQQQNWNIICCLPTIWES